MSGVKQSRLRRLALPLLAGAGVFAVTGCESGELARFAPPGIVKYEDLAGDQPVNPDVAKRIEERRAEKDAGKFPRLAETPDRDDRPEKRPSAEVSAEMAELVGARNELSENVAEDRMAAEADLERDLSAESDELKTRIDADNAAAARERREKLVAPDPDQ